MCKHGILTPIQETIAPSVTHSFQYQNLHFNYSTLFGVIAIVYALVLKQANMQNMGSNFKLMYLPMSCFATAYSINPLPTSHEFCYPLLLSAYVLR